ncbi:eCIS core domain-containing protein [Deinococcus sp. UYEF24]
MQAAQLEVQRVADPSVPGQTRWLSGADRERHVGTLRSIGHGLAQGFKTDSSPAVQRYAEYGEGLATLQRQGLTAAIPRMVLAQLSPTERPTLQRAVGEAVQRQQHQEVEDAAVLQRHSLQRQLADIDQQAEQPILERIQARRGGGTPLPAAVQRQLEAGLNHDLSGVRVHTDGEADLLSKKVNAVAFTTGQDIYFQSGKFDPNSRTGVELLAHEATHTVQQSKGQVGKGIDPDAGLEAEARQSGQRIASGFRASSAPIRPSSARHSRAASPSLQRAVAAPEPRSAEPKPPSPSGAAGEIAKPTPGVNKAGFIDSDDGANIRTAPAELTGSRSLTPAPLPPGTRVFVSGTHPQKPEWLYVTAVRSGTMLRGYVQNFRVTTKLPEPTATLYQIKGGAALEPIAAGIYHQHIQPGRDLRFYEEAVLDLNQKAGRAGVRRTAGGIELVSGHRIWLPSPAFANALQGKIPNGSLTGGGYTRAKQVGQHLVDILASVHDSPNHLAAVGAEYAKAIMDNLPEIIGVTAAFLLAESASAFLAATPTGVGQLAAGVIQLGLAAWGAKGGLEAAAAALPHAQRWLTLAWTANGEAKQIAQASESFLRMMAQVALAALALTGAKGNLGKGMRLVDGVHIEPPSFGLMQTAGGPAVGVPVFRPGSITALGEAAPVRPTLKAVGAASSGRIKTSQNPPNERQANPSEPVPASELEKALTNKNLSDEQIEALLKKTKNWDELKDYVGTKADKGATPPPGYEWYTVDGKTLIRRLKGNKASGDYAPLTVKEGVVVLNAGGGTRIAMYSRYRRNFLTYTAEQSQSLGKNGAASRAAAERLLNQVAADGRPLYQLHHMIADNVAQSNALFRIALDKIKGFTVDRGSNMFALPRRLRPGEPYIHNGSHPRYDAWVNDELNATTNKLLREKRVPLEDINASDIERAIEAVENRIRQRLQDRDLPDGVWDELQTGGKKLSQIEPTMTQETEYA